MLASELEQLIEGLPETKHPITSLFDALLKAGLESVREEIERLQGEIGDVTAMAEIYNCNLTPPLIILGPRRG